MNNVLFFDVCLALLFIGVGVLCCMLPLVVNNSSNKRGFVFYFSSGGLLAFTMNFFKELEPPGLDTPIKYTSNILAILGFLLILTLTTLFVSDTSKAEYAFVDDVEDGSSRDIDIEEIEMMLSDSKRSVSSGHNTFRDVIAEGKAREKSVLSDTFSEKFIISTSTVVVLSYLNFFIGFWFSSKEHTGYKDLIVAIFNHCLLAIALSAIIVSLHRPHLPSLFWPFVVCLTCSAPLGIITGSLYSHAYAEGGGIQDPFMHSHLKILIHLGLCLCRGLLLYISTVCMISHAIVNKNYDRTSNVVAILCGSVLFSFMNEF
jgi:hypothetical protein